MAEVWDWPGASGTRTVDSHVKGLRAKLGGDLIRTVHGVGYALEIGGRRVTAQPLARVTSLKVKLGLLVAASVTVASVVATPGQRGRRAGLAQHPGHDPARPGRDPAARRRA